MDETPTVVPAPTATASLRPAEPDELLETLAFALRYDGRRRVDTAGEMTARIAAKHLAEHLRMSGFVIMKKPPAPGHST